MFSKPCTQCGHDAKPSFDVDAHDLHVAHRGYEAIEKFPIARIHPFLALGGLVVGTAWKAVETFHWHCSHCGHSFK